MYYYVIAYACVREMVCVGSCDFLLGAGCKLDYKFAAIT